MIEVYLNPVNENIWGDIDEKVGAALATLPLPPAPCPSMTCPYSFRGMHWKGGVTPPIPSRMPMYAQPLAP